MKSLFLALFLVATSFAATPSSLDKISSTLVYDGVWTTIINISNDGVQADLNKPAATIVTPLSFYRDDGTSFLPNVQVSGATSTVSGNDVLITLPPNGSAFVTVIPNTSANSKLGSARLGAPCNTNSTCANLNATLTIRNSVPAVRPDFEAVTGFASAGYLWRTGQTLFIPIDQTNYFNSYILFVHPQADPKNPCPFLSCIDTSAARITMSFIDANGNVALSDTVALGDFQSTLIDVYTKYPALSNFRGTVRCDVLGGYVIASGVRINPTDSFTSLAVFEPQI